MTATVHRIKAGPLPAIDTRRECRLSSDHRADLMQIGAQRSAFAGDPGEEMHDSGGSVPVVLITLCVLLPMALWAVVALAIHFAKQL